MITTRHTRLNFRWTPDAAKKISIVCTIEDAYEKDAFATAAAEMARFDALEEKSLATMIELADDY